jgi:hypothetical protein
MTEANTPIAALDPQFRARIAAQDKASILWHRKHGLGDRVSVGCPYDPDRSGPVDHVYVVTLDDAGELVYTLENADAFEAERLYAERRRAAQRASSDS